MTDDDKNNLAKDMTDIIDLDQDMKIFHDIAKQKAEDCDGDIHRYCIAIKPHISWLMNRIAITHAGLASRAKPPAASIQ